MVDSRRYNSRARRTSEWVGALQRSADRFTASGIIPGPRISPPFSYARRSARSKGAYSLQPAQRSVSYPFAVFRSVPPSQRHLSPSRRTAVRYAGQDSTVKDTLIHSRNCARVDFGSPARRGDGSVAMATGPATQHLIRGKRGVARLHRPLRSAPCRGKRDTNAAV